MHFVVGYGCRIDVVEHVHETFAALAVVRLGE
jgi:hypothetical protein